VTLVSDAMAIAREGIRAVDPARAVHRSLERTTTGLRLGHHRLQPGPGGQLRLVAIGKAASAMVDAAARVVGSGTSGIAVTPQGYPATQSSIPVVFGSHPVPDRRSFQAGKAVLEFVRATRVSDAVLFLISGGGSAVAEVPAGSLRPHELSRTTQELLASGAPIGAMNAIRRHISALKGGQLALATPARYRATLALSDVVGDVPADIASGPTVGDPSTFRDALSVARQYRMTSRLPTRVLRHLEGGVAGRVPETPKPDDPRLRGMSFVLAATNRIALEAAATEARRRRYSVRIVSRHVTGETQSTAREFAQNLLRPRSSPRFRSRGILSGGETTVTLGKRPGLGGRNQEFCLAAAQEIAGRAAVVLSVGTDGIDGPTDAAGGWTDGRSMERARRRGVDVEAALLEHASYPALAALGSLVRTGPTGTNVMDLHIGLVRSRVSPDTEGSTRRSAAPSSRRRRS